MCGDRRRRRRFKLGAKNMIFRKNVEGCLSCNAIFLVTDYNNNDDDDFNGGIMIDSSFTTTTL